MKLFVPFAFGGINSERINPKSATSTLSIMERFTLRYVEEALM